MKSFTAIIENGKITLPEGFKEGERLFIEVGHWKNKRSLPQNSYYWGVILEAISYSTGHTPMELHEIFKRMFLKPQFINYRGREIKLPNTTTKLSTSEFNDYLERIIAEAGELGITIPSPEWQ